LNALSLAGVGRGTVLEFVEVYAGADDGFEIWGGAVNSRYLVASYCSDEMFDMDQGHEGKHQFWFGLQAISGDEGVELNGQPSGGSNVNVAGAPPLGRHQIYNATIIGEGGPGSGSDAMNTRSDYYGSIHNSIFMQFQGRDQVSSVPTYNGTVTHNVFWENVGGRGIVDLANNAFADPLLVMIDRGQNEALDPRPAANSPVFTGAMEAPKDGFFVAAPYKGAFKDAQWALDWTALTDNLHLKPVAQALVCEYPAEATVAVEPPVLTARLDGSNVVLTFASQAGVKYQVQTRAAFGAGDWVNQGGLLDGNGQTLTHTETVETANKFFRVLAQ
jgi:hypothetical protein